MNALLNLDRALFRVINGPSGHHALLDSVMVACAQYSPVLFALALALLWFTWQPRNQRGALLAGSSALIALGLGQIIGKLIPRARPFEASDLGPVHLLHPHSPDTSFPSDHATLVFAITIALWSSIDGSASSRCCSRCGSVWRVSTSARTIQAT